MQMHSTNLLDLFDGPLSPATPPQPTLAESTVTGSASSFQSSASGGLLSPTGGGNVLSPHTSSDFSLLDPSPASSKPHLLPTDAQPTLALTLFEKPVGSGRVPQEYAAFPVSPGCDNKVLFCEDFCWD